MTETTLGSIVKYFQGGAEIYDYKREILEKVHTRQHDFRDLALETLMQNTVNCYYYAEEVTKTQTFLPLTLLILHLFLIF